MASKKIKGLTVEFNGDVTGLKNALNIVLSSVKETDQALKNVNKALKLNPSNIELIASKTALLEKSIKENEAALKQFQKLQSQLDAKGVNKASKEYTELQLKIEDCKKSVEKYSAELRAIPYQEASLKAKKLANDFDELYKMTKRVSQLSFAGLFATGFNAAQIESSVAKIKKIYRDLSDSTVDSLKEISVANASAFDDIAGYASIGATLGIAEKDLSTFADAMKKLETVTDGAIIGEDGAKKVARFLNIMNIGADEVTNFGSALTIVEDKLAVTADEVLEVSSRLGALSTINGITQHDLIGLSASMMNLGLRAESGASAITRVFLKIEDEVKSSGDLLETFAETAGMTADEFTDAWSTDPMQSFLKFTDGLKSSVFREINQAVKDNSEVLKDYAESLGMSASAFSDLWKDNPKDLFEKYISSLEEIDDTGESASSTLRLLKLNGVRTAETLLKLAGSSETVNEMIKISNEEWEKNTALTDKANIIYETTESKLKKAWESIKLMAGAIGDGLLPYVKGAADGITELTKAVGNSKEWQTAIKLALGFGASLAPIFKISSKVNKLKGAYYDALKTVNSELKVSQKLLLGLGGNINILAGAGGLGLLTIGLSAVHTAFRKTNEEAKKFALNAIENNDVLQETILNSKDLFNTEAYRYAQEERQVQLINQLLNTRKELNVSDSEYVQNTNEINDALQLLNSYLGENKYKFDESKGAIVDENEAVIDLKTAYAELSEERKKQSFLEANQDTIIEAEKSKANAIELQRDALKSYNEEMSKYDPSIFEEAQKFVNGEGYDTSLWDNTDFQSAVDLIQKLGVTFQTTNETIAQSTDIIQFFDDIKDMPWEESKQKINEWQQGLYVPQSELDNLDTLKNKIKETMDEMALIEETSSKGGFYDEERYAVLQQQLNDLVEQRKLLEEQMTIATESALSNTQELAGSISQEIGATFTDEMPLRITDPIKQAMEDGTNSALEMWNSWVVPNKKVYVDVEYNYPSNFASSQVEYSPQSRSEEPSPFAMARSRAKVEPIELPRMITVNNTNNFNDIVRSISDVLNQSEKNFNFEEVISKALEKIVVSPQINIDMDGRKIASQISVIQGLNIKKQR